MPDQRRNPKWPLIAAPAALAVLAAGYSYFLSGRFFGVENDPYLVVAAQVARGARLYVDTMVWHTPLSVLLGALLVRWLGVSLRLSIFSGRLLAGLESLWIYALARRLRMTPAWAALAGVLALLWGGEMGVLGRTPAPYMCVGVFFATGALFLGLAARGAGGMFAAGLLGGLAFWSYQPSGMQVALALGAWLLLRAAGVIPTPAGVPRGVGRALGALLFFLMGLGVVTLLVWLWARAPGQWSEMIRLIRDAPREELGQRVGRWREIWDALVPPKLDRGGLVYVRDMAPHPFALVAWALNLLMNCSRSFRRFSSLILVFS